MREYDFALSREPAPPEDLDILETSATTLLGPVPAELRRQYELKTPDGSYLYMETCTLENKAELGNFATIDMGLEYEDGDRDTLIEATFDFDNLPIDEYEDPDDLERAMAVAEDLLNNTLGPLDPDDRLLLEHLKDWAERCAYGHGHGHTDLLYFDTSGDGITSTGDVIRRRVDTSQGIVVTKVWSMALGQERVLHIQSHEPLGIPANDERLKYLPALEIKYEDRLAQLTYLYIKDQWGQPALKFFDGSDLDPEELSTAIDDWCESVNEGEEVEPPNAQDVWFLIGKAKEAELVDTN